MKPVLNMGKNYQFYDTDVPAYGEIAANPAVARSFGLTQECAWQGIILGDHAGSAVPQCLANLALGDDWPTIKAKHIACDHGVAGVVQHLASLTGLTALWGHYSRLVIDLNRRPEDITSIRALYDGQMIPANYRLIDEDRNWRKTAIFDAYHQKITAELTKFGQVSDKIFVFSIHSFGAQVGGEQRPWQLGVLSNHDRRMADHMLAWLAQHHPELHIGDNLPYSGFDPYGYTLEHHAIPKHYHHLLLEIRQDLIGDDKGQLTVASWLAAWLKSWLTAA